MSAGAIRTVLCAIARWLFPVAVALLLLCGGAYGQERHEAGAVFLRTNGVLRLNLDSGEERWLELEGEPQTYRHEILRGGAHLLSFVDRELTPGFAVLDAKRAPRIAVRGGVAYMLGDGFLVGVRIAEPVERVVGKSEVTLWSLASFRRLLRLDRAIPLTTLGLDYRSLEPDEQRSRDLLLLRFTPSRGGDPNCPWEQSLGLMLISSETGKSLWKRKLDPGFLLAGLDLLWQDQDLLLLAGRVDLNHYYYACLDALKGRLRWQLKTERFPLMQPDYPYQGYASIFPAHRAGGELVFGTVSAEEPYRALSRMNLTSGEMTLTPDPSELEAMRAAWLSLYSEPEPESASSFVLDGLGTLTITPPVKVEFGSRERRWTIPYLPDFGANLQPAAWGRKFIVLVERPAGSLSLGYQAKAHLLETASGKRANLPLPDAVFFEPWSPACGVEVLLTTEEVVELSGAGMSRQRLTLQES